MLKTRYISSRSTWPWFWMNLKIVGTSQEARSISALTTFGSTRGMLSWNPPPVMWAMPVMFTLLASSAETGLRKLLWTARSASPKVLSVPGTLSFHDIWQWSKITLRASE